MNLEIFRGCNDTDAMIPHALTALLFDRLQNWPESGAGIINDRDLVIEMNLSDSKRLQLIQPACDCRTLSWVETSLTNTVGSISEHVYARL